jgi:hypothetical protein
MLPYCICGRRRQPSWAVVVHFEILAIVRKIAPVLDPKASEQFRPAILSGLSDHEGRDEHFFSLFQVL